LDLAVGGGAQDLMTSAKNAQIYPTYVVTHKKLKI